MKSILLVVSAAALALAPSVPGQAKKPPEDPVISEFRKFIESHDANVRRDQVERLVKLQTPESVALVVARGLTDQDVDVRAKAVWVLSQMGEPEARAAVVAALDHQKAEIREGAALAVGTMSDPDPAVVVKLAALVSGDKSAQVQAAAAESLGRLGSKDGTTALCRAAASRDEDVAIAAADALAMVKDPASASTLIPLLDHKSWRVQVAALNGLSALRVKESVGPIIDYLRLSEGRPRQDAARALAKITASDFGLDANRWKEWWDRSKDQWEVPPEPKEKTEAETKTDGYGRKATTYHRITTISQRIIFVIDISTSMETPILLKAGKKSSDPLAEREGTPKIKIAREELAFTLRGMDPETKFNVVAFETDVRPWQKEPVSASAGNVQSAIRWIESQRSRKPGPGGGGIDSEGRMVGRTNTYEALRFVFGLPPKRSAESTGGTTPGGPGRKPKTAWDTCFFLSDGEPTEGVITDIDEILAEVERWNKTNKMIVHCIGMEEEQGLVNLLNGLARLTEGKCIFVGK